MKVIGIVPSSNRFEDPAVLVEMTQDELSRIAHGEAGHIVSTKPGTTVEVHKLFNRQQALGGNRYKIEEVIKTLGYVAKTLEPIIDIVTLPDQRSDETKGEG